MQPPSISDLVHSHLYPKPTSIDPSTFYAFATRHLVAEVRLEVVCFYGPHETLESRYPGLDYTDKGHRLRLSRFPFHKKLFDAFDGLRLSEAEILSLCRWEGTKWAKDRFEQQESVKIRDTTWDGMECAIKGPPATSTVDQLSELRGGGSWHHPPGRYDLAVPYSQFSFGDALHNYEETRGMDGSEEDEVDEDQAEDEDEDGEEDEEMLLDEQESEADPLEQSIGVDLNQRLLAGAEAGVEARARGEEAVLDADWEQWLKEAVERGTIPSLAGLTAVPGPDHSHVSSWGQSVPEVFRYGPGDVPAPRISTLQTRMPQPPRLRDQRARLIRDIRPRPTGNP